MANSRYYSSVAGKMVLQGTITSGDTSIVVDTASGLPSSYPFTLILDPGLSSEEIVNCTAASGTTLTLVRGQDGTTAQSHTSGGEVRHGMSARDLTDSRTHEAAVNGVHGVTGNVVGTTDVQALTHKDLSDATNSFPSTLATDAELTTHANNTATHGATGAIVGTTNTQTLTNKNLTSSTNTFPSTLIATTGAQSMQDKTAQASAAGNHALIIKGAASQTADILSIQDSTGAAICAMTPSGWVVDGGSTVTQCTGAGANLFGFVTKFVATGASQIVQIIKAAAGQTADLMQWQNSAGTPVAKIDASGNFTAANFNSGAWTSYTPVLINATTGGSLASSSASGKYRISGKQITVIGSITATSATTGGAGVSLPIASVSRDLNCGTLGIFGSTFPSDQSGIAFMTADQSHLVCIAYTGGYRDAPAGDAIRWAVTYEIA